MVCERCGIEHNGDYGSGRFCSRACANARNWTDEQKKDLSKKLRVIPDRYCKVCGKLLSRSGKSELCILCSREQRTGSGKYKTATSDWRGYTKERRQQLKRNYVQLYGGKCLKCGYSAYSSALEFHHKDPSQKEIELAKNLFARSKKTIEAELSKCILLCCRCHREVHEYIRQGGTLEEYLEATD